LSFAQRTRANNPYCGKRGNCRPRRRGTRSENPQRFLTISREA
jgi:hypothetical protein